MKLVKITTLVVLTVLIQACSEDSGSIGGENSPAQSIGVFVDSAVSGIKYTTDSVSGYTGFGGQFPFVAGENITFSIGDIVLPTVPVKKIITPLDIFSTTDINDISVVNLSRLLQTLDCDEDTSNGIEFCDGIGDAATGISVDFSSDSFDTDIGVLVSIGAPVSRTLVDSITATSHLQQSINSSLPSGIYYEVYGAMVGDYRRTTSGRDLLGTSDGGSVFNISGYDRFIIYVPSTSDKVKLDYMEVTFNGVSEPIHTDEGIEYALHTSNFYWPHEFNCNLGELCTVDGVKQALSFYSALGDGVYIESRTGDPSYINFTTRGADYMRVYLTN